MTNASKSDPLRGIVAQTWGAAEPGCVLGVFRDGHVVSLYASGVADVASGRVLDERTLFYVASISKQFTVLALAKLVEQGKIALEEDVRNWIPELPTYAAPIRIEMLVHHTSGVRDWLALLKLAGVADAGRVDRMSALDLLFRQSRTESIPGTRFLYSNGGYLLLSEVVTRAAGMQFHQFVKGAVLSPMEMNDSFVVAGARPSSDKIAHGYVRVGSEFHIRDTYPLTGGSGGLMTSIADLARYDRDVQVGHKVWTPAVARIMLTPGALADGATAVMGAYGLAYAGGLLVGLRTGRYTVCHGGSAEGVRGNYVSLPDRHLSVAAISNRGDALPAEMTDAVMDSLEGTSFVAESRMRGNANLAPKLAYEVRAAPRQYSLTGVYFAEDLGATYHVTDTGGAIVVAISSPWTDSGNSSANLRLPIASDGSIGDDNFRLVPDQDAGGFTVAVNNRSSMHFTRVGGH